MFGNLIDDLKTKVDGMLKLAVAGAIVAAAAVTAFACFTFALFLWMQQTYGSLEAWLAVGALFAAIAALGGIVVLFLRGRTRKAVTPRPPEPNAVARLLQEPAVLLTGLQIVRVLGRRGLLPMIVLGVVAGGMMMNHRNGHAGREHVAEAERGAQTDLHG